MTPIDNSTQCLLVVDLRLSLSDFGQRLVLGTPSNPKNNGPIRKLPTRSWDGTEQASKLPGNALVVDPARHMRPGPHRRVREYLNQ